MRAEHLQRLQHLLQLLRWLHNDFHTRKVLSEPRVLWDVRSVATKGKGARGASLFMQNGSGALPLSLTEIRLHFELGRYDFDDEWRTKFKSQWAAQNSNCLFSKNLGLKFQYYYFEFAPLILSYLLCALLRV